MYSRDKILGMDRNIARRDFLNGSALAIAAYAAGGAASASATEAAAYPPTLTGMRGHHKGSYEVMHAIRDKDFWNKAGAIVETGEAYDLIVVGGGISGLTAAYLYRQQAGPQARILVLDNHDDFGGHAKRNEFNLGGHLHLMNGGTLEIDSPRPYSPEASGLLKTLGIDPVILAKV